MTKLGKVIRIFYETVGPVCFKDENYFALGARADGKHVAIALLRPGYEPYISVIGAEKFRDPNDMTHKQLDEIISLTWRPIKPLSLLEQIARAAS